MIENRRLAALSALAGGLFLAGAAAADLPPPSSPPTPLLVDADDDDNDGVPDGEQPSVPYSPELFAMRAPPGATPGPATVPPGLRLLVDGSPAPAGAAISPRARRVEIQAVRAGRGDVSLFGEVLHFSAFEVRAIDGAGRRVDMARSHASLQRTPPDRLGDDPLANLDDGDAVRFLAIGAADDVPTTLDLRSVAPSGRVIDLLSSVPLGDVPCPADVAPGLVCGSTRPIRAVSDDIDRNHPMVADRSLKAEVGGALLVAAGGGHELQTLRIAGPRSSPLGPIGRFRARLRILMVRPRAGGPPPMGGDDVGAVAVARAEVERANALWGACGVSFGPLEDLDIAIVDPPRSHLLALGCDHGLPASGGSVRLRVDGHEVTAKIAAGMSPGAAARAVAAAIGAAGFPARISDNPVIGAGAHGSSDVLVRRPGGALATLDPPASGLLSTDATLTACIGLVDLEDGLQHFTDTDAIAGTVEERTLLKAFDDGDPATIEVVMIPSFAGGGRIGESFIFADGGAIRNTIIEDRAGLRADRASFALSHELGHVLLDDPGHPDDFGSDTPTRLMDADAANASAYGPRRLTVDECARAIRQSGAAAFAGPSPSAPTPWSTGGAPAFRPSGPVPLLAPWPMAPLGREK